MGQYHYTVNLDKKEYLNPQKLGDGLKLLEQANSQAGIMVALLALLACSNGRGGGDFDDGLAYLPKGEKFEWTTIDADYAEIAHKFIGRWAGDRIAVIGDYSEPNDIPNCNAQEIYEHLETEYTDISDNVLPIVERACSVKITGEGWRQKDGIQAMRPDLVVK